eukprot:329563-Pleurochrysis_carterae.AAC.9
MYVPLGGQLGGKGGGGTLGGNSGEGDGGGGLDGQGDGGSAGGSEGGANGGGVGGGGDGEGFFGGGCVGGGLEGGTEGGSAGGGKGNGDGGRYGGCDGGTAEAVDLKPSEITWPVLCSLKQKTLGDRAWRRQLSSFDKGADAVELKRCSVANDAANLNRLGQAAFDASVDIKEEEGEGVLQDIPSACDKNPVV